MALTVVTVGVSIVVWSVTLVLFLAFRGAFGAVPEVTAPPAARSAFTSSAGEIVAYVVAVVGVVAALAVFNTMLMPGVYASLRTSGHGDLIVPVSLAVTIVAALAFFLVFVALRAGISTSARE